MSELHCKKRSEAWLLFFPPSVPGNPIQKRPKFFGERFFLLREGKFLRESHLLRGVGWNKFGLMRHFLPVHCGLRWKSWKALGEKYLRPKYFYLFSCWIGHSNWLIPLSLYHLFTELDRSKNIFWPICLTPISSLSSPFQWREKGKYNMDIFMYKL